MQNTPENLRAAALVIAGGGPFMLPDGASAEELARAACLELGQAVRAIDAAHAMAQTNIRRLEAALVLERKTNEFLTVELTTALDELLETGHMATPATSCLDNEYSNGAATSEPPR